MFFVKKNKENLENISDEELLSVSGGRSNFGRIIPNIRKINNRPRDIFPKSRLDEILRKGK